MIISASYRTDIPAFYGPWLMARLAAGWAKVHNPYGGKSTRIDLTPQAIDGFVFWTRNLAPFTGYLPHIARYGPFIVSMTITGYPQELEAATPSPERAIATLQDLAKTWGPRRVVWRYDPIVFTSLTPASWHRENFARLAQTLSGVTDECVVSFVTLYTKTKRNLEAAAQQHGFSFGIPNAEEQRGLLKDLAETAATYGIALTLCAQPELLIPGIVSAARCIDTQRLSDIAGYEISTRTKGNRPGCLCAESRDLGAYDTCPQGCTYCYAVRNSRFAQKNLARHDAREILLGEATSEDAR